MLNMQYYLFKEEIHNLFSTEKVSNGHGSVLVTYLCYLYDEHHIRSSSRPLRYYLSNYRTNLYGRDYMHFTENLDMEYSEGNYP